MVLGYGAYGRFKWTCMVYRCWEDPPYLSRWLLRAICACSASAAQIKQWKHACGEFDSHDAQMLWFPGFSGIPEIRWPTRSSLWFVISVEIALMTEIRAQNAVESSSMMAGMITPASHVIQSQMHGEILRWCVPCHSLSSIWWKNDNGL